MSVTAVVRGRGVRAPAPRLPGPARGSALLAGLAAALPIGVYLWVAAHRLGYPYELDWMEGGSVELVRRVLAGGSLYVAPTLRFVGWTYPPLFSWVSAGVSELTGLGFPALRLVSFAGSLLAMLSLARIAARVSGERLAGLLAAGLFAAAYRLSGSWFDVGRLDSLFLGLTLLALAVGLSARGLRGGLLLGGLAFLATFTKQTALVALLPALVLVALTRPRAGISALLVLLVLLAGSTLLLDATSHGWYRYYVLDELSGQAWVKPEWLGFWRGDLLAPEWPLALLLAAGLLAAARGARARRRGLRALLAAPAAYPLRALPAAPAAYPLRALLAAPAAYPLLAAAGLLAAAWVSRLHTGGYLNVLMPAYAASALLAALAASRLRRAGALPGLLAALLVAGQVALLAYPPGGQLPTRAEGLAGAELLARLRSLPGPVLVLRHPWYATLLGKGSFAQVEGITDVLRSQASRGARSLERSLPRALDADHIRSVVLDGSFDDGLLEPALRREFRLVPGTITRRRLTPLTDVRSAPTLLYVRRGASTSQATASRATATRSRSASSRHTHTTAPPEPA